MGSLNFANSNESRLCLEGKVWELHIHSNQCFSADKELRNLSIEEYVTRLLGLLKDYEDLEMISFTDHNAICFDLYKEFYSRNSSITLLPGIEIDACLEKDGVGKHVIVYFDAINDLPKLQLISSEINAFMAEGPYGSQKGERPIYIHELLDKLVSLGVPFAVSPHAMKQGKRGIDVDMHVLSEEERRNEAKKYIDQFFCFWESSGSQNIHKATEFLREMACGKRISVIEFSDSKDFDKLKEHLDNPRQYFSSLPNFNGLKLAGSGISRIERKKTSIPSVELGNYIGEIRFDDQKISLSPHLNAIIGGRSSGKSILLDSIANCLGIPSGRLHSSAV